MDKEENPFKRRSFVKHILQFYQKAIAIGSGLFDATPIQAEIKKLESQA
jgi:hypothetical protein